MPHPKTPTNDMSEVLTGRPKRESKGSRPPGPKGSPIMGVMREFNRDSLGFIERCARDHGDVVWMRFLYVPALFLYHPNDIEYVLYRARAKNGNDSGVCRSPLSIATESQHTRIPWSSIRSG